MVKQSVMVSAGPLSGGNVERYLCWSVVVLPFCYTVPVHCSVGVLAAAVLVAVDAGSGALIVYTVLLFLFCLFLVRVFGGCSLLLP